MAFGPPFPTFAHRLPRLVSTLLTRTGLATDTTMNSWMFEPAVGVVGHGLGVLRAVCQPVPCIRPDMNIRLTIDLSSMAEL